MLHNDSVTHFFALICWKISIIENLFNLYDEMLSVKIIDIRAHQFFGIRHFQKYFLELNWRQNFVQMKHSMMAFAFRPSDFDSRLSGYDLPVLCEWFQYFNNYIYHIIGRRSRLRYHSIRNTMLSLLLVSVSPPHTDSHRQPNKMLMAMKAMTMRAICQFVKSELFIK